jgi:pimeloyl-ACP methyl ester carboxylesterase
MRSYLIVIAALTAAMAWSAPATALELSDCHLSIPDSPARVAARCGTHRVAENRAEQGGREIGLKVAVLPATTRGQESDPLVFITGGPGQSALESFVQARGAFSRINRKRDIVLVDQRGTGGSNRLACSTTEGWDPVQSSPEQQLALVSACLEELDGDPRFYTTSVAIQDLDEVLDALGYDAINLYGISYGTRVAQAYARRYPGRTRTVVLDGIVPLDLALGPGISLDAQRALEMMFERCAGSTDCSERFPTLATDFAGLQERLRESPVQLVLADPTSGELAEQVFTEDWLRGVVRMFSYAPETVALLPLLINHAAVTGDFVPLAAQALLVSRQMDESIAMGMHNAVVCTEDVPFIADGDDGGVDTYLGVGMVEMLRDACAIWPNGVMDEGFKSAWSSDIPALLLSGEADPVTPPQNGEHLLQTLSSAIHLVGRGQGHGMFARGCTPRIMEAFIDSGTVEALDASCLDRLRPAPFFLRFTGPNP